MAISRSVRSIFPIALIALLMAAIASGQRQTTAIAAAVTDAAASRRALLDKYCIGCHSQRLKTAGLVLEGLDTTRVAENAGIWERVLRQFGGGQMPPPGLPRPDSDTAVVFTKTLETALDRAAAEKPNPGATMPHRMNRAEYSNAVRDLLQLDIRAGNMFPVDESGSGFDNMADLLSMSPALLERYMSAARMISRLAVGDLKMKPVGEEYGNSGRGQRREPDAEDLPLNARGGVAFQHYFPVDADYDIKITLPILGGDAPILPPYQYRVPVKAGLHSVVATFLRESARMEAPAPVALRRGALGPPELTAELDLRLDGVRLQRIQTPQRSAAPEIATVTVTGPFNVTGRGDTPSRAKIFVCHPANPTSGSSPSNEEPCARTIFSNLARRAFRRPVTEFDLRPLLAFYRDGRAEGDFDAGIQNGLQALLVSPDFLYRVERDPKAAAPGSVYKLNDYELASRLSFFLWSGIPDDELLKLAALGKLKDPAVLRAQTQRMLDDPRADALSANFGGQWLFLRTLAGHKPDADIFSNFDENLRAAFQRETELYVAGIFREDRSVLDLLDSDYTFLNQRLAEHYKVPNVYGSHFRKVMLPPDAHRGGLLGQGSVLTVSSYPNRTSVVLRGKWILENLLSTPPPPPPPNVPELKAQAKDGRKLSLREAMETHRANPVCASCHSRLDPMGFAMENFNAIGEWRTEDSGVTIDANGKLPNGSQFEGPGGLKKLLLSRYKDDFIQTVTQKLLTYALGRELEPYDKPVVRTIARGAARDDFRMSAFVIGVVESVPFQMRRAREK